MESGPVGGIIASAQVGLALGFPNVISFDMGGTTAKASLIRDGEPTLAPGYYVGGYAVGPSGDAADDRRGRGRRRRRQHRLDRRHRRAEGRAAERGRRSRARSATAAAAPSRPSPTPMWCWAGSTRTISSAAPMKLDADGARGAASRRRSPSRSKLDTVAAAQAIVDIADQQDVARGARGVGRQGLRSARLRAGGVGRRRAAACLRHRARALHPDRDRAAVSLAFLGARHAAGRRAPRLHPHGLFAIWPASISPSW